jgi:hypothetical protein
MVVIVELLYGTEGRRKKENDRASIISENITSVKIEEIRICIESC